MTSREEVTDPKLWLPQLVDTSWRHNIKNGFEEEFESVHFSSFFQKQKKRFESKTAPSEATVKCQKNPFCFRRLCSLFKNSNILSPKNTNISHQLTNYSCFFLNGFWLTRFVGFQPTTSIRLKSQRALQCLGYGMLNLISKWHLDTKQTLSSFRMREAHESKKQHKYQKRKWLLVNVANQVIEKANNLK